MERTLPSRLGLLARKWWLALGIVANDDGLESDLMPAAFAQSSLLAKRNPAPILARQEA